jgi:diacylglycerol kinase (ATP)
MPCAYLVYNPIAGRYSSWVLTERAASLLQGQGWEIHIVQAESGDEITQLARQAADEQMDALFVAGGDGSINQAIIGLLGSETALGVLPAGTANVWAQELGLPGLSWTHWTALEESARQLARASVRRVDVGMCNQRPFLLWAGVGLDAFVVHRLEPRTRLEKYFAVVHYTASAIWNATLWHGMNLRVEADGKSISGHFLLAVLSNIHLYFGGYAELSTEARLDDGLMDLWLFSGESFGDTIHLTRDLLSGRHKESTQVSYVPFRSLRLESDAPMYLQVDGEPAEAGESIRVEVRQEALRVLVPENTPHPLFTP